MSKGTMRIINPQEFERDIERVKQILSGSVLLRAAMAGARVVEREAKLAIQSPPKTGIVYKRGDRDHQASAPGEAPATDTGNLVNSITVAAKEVGQDYAEAGVGPTAEYGAYLEYGTSRMAPRPYMRPVLDAHRDKIKKAVAASLKRALRQAMKGP